MASTSANIITIHYNPDNCVFTIFYSVNGMDATGSIALKNHDPLWAKLHIFFTKYRSPSPYPDATCRCWIRGGEDLFDELLDALENPDEPY